MTAVVTDAMVHRARVVLRLHAPYELPAHALKAAIEAALTDPRLCKGCTASLADMRKDAEWCSRACKIRTDRRVAAEQAAQTTNPRVKRPGGVQLSYLRARALLEGPIALHVLGSPVACEDATRWAESQLRPLLSDRQRARLERMDLV